MKLIEDLSLALPFLFFFSQIIPDDVAKEKVALLKFMGAEIESVRPRGIVDPRHVSCRILRY